MITGDEVIGLTHYGVGQQVVVFGIACHRGDGVFDAGDDFADAVQNGDQVGEFFRLDAYS